jgi:RNA polymerase sigma factor (sigma-70 family)
MTTATADPSSFTEVGFELHLRQVYAEPTLKKGVDGAPNEDERLYRAIRPGLVIERKQGLPGRPADVLKAIGDAMDNLIDERHHRLNMERLIKGIRPYLIRRARNRFMGRGVDLEDLYQEGLTGVMRAMEDWDPQIAGFLTYADDWIGQRMGRLCEDMGSIDRHGARLPSHMYGLVGRVQHAMPLLVEGLGREPSDQEVLLAVSRPKERPLTLLDVKAMGQRAIDERNGKVFPPQEEDASVVMRKGRPLKLSEVKRAREVLSWRLESMDAERGTSTDESSVTLADAIADPNGVAAIDHVSEEDRRAAIWGQAWPQLDELQQNIIKDRLGLTDSGGMHPDGSLTQDQVCEKYGIKKSRMVSIYHAGLSALREAPVFREIAQERGFLDAAEV